jgi:hypothetical protein
MVLLFSAPTIIPTPPETFPGDVVARCQRGESVGTDLLEADFGITSGASLRFGSLFGSAESHADRMRR